MKVNILTYCKTQSSLYGNCLIFKTLRIGFPNAEIFVFDNASPIKLSKKIETLAKENDCHFVRLKKETPHYSVYDYFINNNISNEPLAFVHPDICFWEKCEDWKFDGLMAGRLIPKYYADEFDDCITLDRIHPSFLWIPNSKKLIEKLNAVKNLYEPYRPFTCFLENQWYRYDTLALLFSVFEKQIHTFNDKELNSYDHLFCGTHLNLIKKHLKDNGELQKTHDQVKKDYKLIKGIWQKQEEYFNNRRIINE